MDRRAILKGAAALTIIPVIRIAAAQNETEIERLFAEWLAVANGPQDPAEDDTWGESSYVRLQAQVLAAEPTSARDLAIQCYVDCDQLGSDNSDHFEALILRLVGPIREAA